MKKSLFNILFIGISYFAFAQQVLVGTYRDGGPEDSGGIYSIDFSGENYQILVPIPLKSAGKNPFAGLMKHSSGRVFGVTASGGENLGGVLYEWDLVTSSQINVISDAFASPNDVPIELPDGRLLGISSFGGNVHGTGSIYIYDIDEQEVDIVFEFDPSTDGGDPYRTPRLASNGLVYGTTSFGGTDNKGTVYSYDFVNDVFSVIYNFGSGVSTNTQGASSPIEASDGLLYGVTQEGVIFSIDRANGNAYSEKYIMDNATDGGSVTAGLIEASNGLLYGVSSTGGINNNGTIFTWNTQTNTFTKIFDNDINIGRTFYNFTIGQDGKLYNVSTTTDAFYQIDPATNQVTELFDFDQADTEVRQPVGNLVEINSGFFLGTGQRNDGGVYSLDLNTLTYSTLLQFGEFIAGKAPFKGVVNGGDGWLYGVTIQGTPSLYRVKPETKEFELLHEFVSTGSSGGLISDQPSGSLIVGSDGLIYGTTTFGGTNDLGTIFSYDPISETYNRLHSFSGSDGSYPNSLTFGSTTKLYGSTFGGGGLGIDAGVIFEFNISTNTYTKLGDMDAMVTGGEKPGPLVMGPNNILYGTTSSVTAIFGFNTNTNTFVTPTVFPSNATGNVIVSKLTVDFARSKLYGAASFGGANNLGTLFQYDIGSSVLGVLHNFSGNTGEPEGDMVLINDKLIGTFNGQSGGFFEFDLTVLPFRGFNVISVANKPTGNGFIGGFDSYCLPPISKVEQLSYQVCAGETLTLDAVAENAGGFQWMGPDGNPITNAISPQLTLSDITQADQGNYTVQMGNACGQSTKTFSVEVYQVNSGFNISFVSCQGGSDGSISLSASGGVAPYSYSIDNGLTSQSDNSFSNLSAGVYEVMITDAIGCVQRRQLTVSEPDPIESPIAAIDATCNGESSGSITFTAASGGTAPFTYSIDNGVTSQSELLFENISAGVYETLVTDANGCELRQQVTLSQPEELVLVATVDNSAKSITINATGGTAPYAYSQDGTNFQGSNVFENLGGGSYEITVRDANACLANTEMLDIVLSIRTLGAKIYPNPAIYELRIEGVEFDYGRIFDLNGKEVSSFNTSETLIDGLKAGLYILKLYENQDLIHTEKIKVN